MIKCPYNQCNKTFLSITNLACHLMSDYHKNKLSYIRRGMSFSELIILLRSEYQTSGGLKKWME